MVSDDDFLSKIYDQALVVIMYLQNTRRFSESDGLHIVLNWKLENFFVIFYSFSKNFLILSISRGYRIVKSKGNTGFKSVSNISTVTKACANNAWMQKLNMIDLTHRAIVCT